MRDAFPTAGVARDEAQAAEAEPQQTQPVKEDEHPEVRVCQYTAAATTQPVMEDLGAEDSREEAVNTAHPVIEDMVGEDSPAVAAEDERPEVQACQYTAAATNQPVKQALGEEAEAEVQVPDRIAAEPQPDDEDGTAQVHGEVLAAEAEVPQPDDGDGTAQVHGLLVRGKVERVPVHDSGGAEVLAAEAEVHIREHTAAAPTQPIKQVLGEEAEVQVPGRPAAEARVPDHTKAEPQPDDGDGTEKVHGVLVGGEVERVPVDDSGGAAVLAEAEVHVCAHTAAVLTAIHSALVLTAVAATVVLTAAGCVKPPSALADKPLATGADKSPSAVSEAVPAAGGAHDEAPAAGGAPDEAPAVRT